MEGEGGRAVDWSVKVGGWWIGERRGRDGGLEDEGGRKVDWRVKG